MLNLVAQLGWTRIKLLERPGTEREAERGWLRYGETGAKAKKPMDLRADL